MDIDLKARDSGRIFGRSLCIKIVSIEVNSYFVKDFFLSESVMDNCRAKINTITILYYIIIQVQSSFYRLEVPDTG